MIALWEAWNSDLQINVFELVQLQKESQLARYKTVGSLFTRVDEELKFVLPRTNPASG